MNTGQPPMSMLMRSRNTELNSWSMKPCKALACRSRTSIGSRHRKIGKIALENVKHTGGPLAPPPPPCVGPADRYFHVVYVGTRKDQAVEEYGELDADPGPFRWIRRHRDGRLEGYSYASDSSRDEMPEGTRPPIADINRNPQFFAKEIFKSRVRDCVGPGEP